VLAGQRPGKLFRKSLCKTLQIEASAVGTEAKHRDLWPVTPAPGVRYREVRAVLCLASDGAAPRERCRRRLAEAAPKVCCEAPEMGKAKARGEFGDRRTVVGPEQCIAHHGKTHLTEMR
jgi:hypothetical protein